MKGPKPTNKILIALLFWDGDKALAMRLAKLLSDLEPGHSTEADFLFVPRFDCRWDDRMVKYVSRKFNTFTHVSKRRSVGWPLGCNGLFFGMSEWVFHKMESGQIPNYKAVFVMGADGVPFRQDWITYLHREWDAANSKKKIYMAGALILDEHTDRGNDHINGDCALLSGDLKFFRWIVRDVRDISTSAGWDWILAKDFKTWGWAGFPGIRSHWRRPDLNEAEWDAEIAEGTVWLHGVKNDSLINIARKKLFLV